MTTEGGQEVGPGGRKPSYLGGSIALAGAIAAQLVATLVASPGSSPEGPGGADLVAGVGAAAHLVTVVLGVIGVVLLIRAGRAAAPRPKG